MPASQSSLEMAKEDRWGRVGVGPKMAFGDGRELARKFCENLQGMGLASLPTAKLPKPIAKCCRHGLGEPHVLGEQRLAVFNEFANAAYRFFTVGRSRFEPSS